MRTGWARCGLVANRGCVSSVDESEKVTKRIGDEGSVLREWVKRLDAGTATLIRGG